MEFLTAKFSSKCSETGAAIRKGDPILYDRTQKKAYSSISEKYRNERERVSTSETVQAQEDAYFDNFCQQNNI